MTSEQYKKTYNELLSAMPRWKQLAVREDSENNNWSGILTEFIQNVIYIAEKEFDSLTSLKKTNTVKKLKVSKKIKTPTKKLKKG